MKYIGFDDKTVCVVQFRSIGGRHGAVYDFGLPADMVSALGWSRRDRPILIELHPETKSMTLSQVDPDEYGVEPERPHASRWVARK